MARTMTVALGDELWEYIESLIESGDYRTQSEVIRESLRLLQRNRQSHVSRCPAGFTGRRLEQR